MHLTDLDLFYWTAGFAGHLILLMVLLRHRQFSEFPIFTVWIASNLLRTAILAMVAYTESKAFYYYAYWSLAAVDLALQLGIVYEMYSHIFRPLGRWAEDVRRTLAWILLGSVVIAAGLTGFAAPHTKLWVEKLTVRVNLFSSLWMSELFVGMIAIALSVGLPWKPHVVRLSEGLGVYSLFGVIIEAGNTYFGIGGNQRIYDFLSHCRMTLYLACVIYWTTAFWKEVPVCSEMSQEMGRRLNELCAMARRDLDILRLWRRR